MTDYAAWIREGEDLVEVDLRDLDAVHLVALRQEAGEAGDHRAVAAIDELLEEL